MKYIYLFFRLRLFVDYDKYFNIVAYNLIKDHHSNF